MKGKMGKEVRIGIVVVLAVILLIFGLKFLLGQSIFSSENQYYTYYSDVKGLQESNSVLVSGLTVGRIEAIELQPDRTVKVTFTVRKNLPLPEGTAAELASADLISGSKNIVLHFGTGSQIVANGSEIPSASSTGMLAGISDQINPTLGNVRSLTGRLDTVASSVQDMFSPDAQQHLQRTLQSMDQAMAQMAELAQKLNEQSGHLAGIIKNADAITGNLAKNNDNINQTLTNFNTLSQNLAKVDINSTLKNLDEVTANLKSITNQINNNDGTLGLLLNNKDLYNNLSSTLASLDAVLADMKQHPAKYINISVLGRKVK